MLRMTSIIRILKLLSSMFDVASIAKAKWIKLQRESLTETYLWLSGYRGKKYYLFRIVNINKSVKKGSFSKVKRVDFYRTLFRIASFDLYSSIGIQL